MKNFFPRFLLVLPVRILDSSLLKTKQNKRVCSLLYLPTFYSHPSQVSIYLLLLLLSRRNRKNNARNSPFANVVKTRDDEKKSKLQNKFFGV